jgi:protein-disulfide isomerase
VSRIPCHTLLAAFAVAAFATALPGQTRDSLGYPLPGHRFANIAARASDCAGNQGRFPGMHNALFTNQDSLGLKPWDVLAAEAGVRDISTFMDCLSSTSQLETVEHGIRVGDAIGITGTPTIIINGWQYASPPRNLGEEIEKRTKKG